MNSQVSREARRQALASMRNVVPLLFLSYSHCNRREKDRLCVHLLGLERPLGLKNSNRILLWADDRIKVGSDWRRELMEALDEVKVAILLISPEFLTSEFIMEVEVPEILRRREEEGLTVIAVLAKPCTIGPHKWLMKMEHRPKEGFVWDTTCLADIESRLTAITSEVYSILTAILEKEEKAAQLAEQNNEVHEGVEVQENGRSTEMNSSCSPLDALNDPQVRSYFLGVLSSSLPDEEKFQRFVDYFGKEAEVRDKLLARLSASPEEGVWGGVFEKAVGEVSIDVGAWKPDKVRQQTANAIERAVRRLHRSRSPDRGWGPEFEKSNFWGTAHAVLCLSAAKSKLFDFRDVSVDGMLKDGIEWLRRHDCDWSVDHLHPGKLRDFVSISLAIRCFQEVAQQFGEQPPPAVLHGIQQLGVRQNDDGGWDATMWPPGVSTPVGIWSEVPATSFSVQALAGARDQNLRDRVRKGVQWLTRRQNTDGSWNRRPGSEGPGDGATVVRTCEAIQGILAAREFGVETEGVERIIERAVVWLESQEKAILDTENNIIGWGWGYSTYDFENTCLTLETLVRLPGQSLPLLAANAQWLINNQVKDENNEEYGAWRQGDTARITRSLIEFHSRLPIPESQP